MVMMVVDSSNVGLGMRSVTEMDGKDVVIVSEMLEDLGGVVMVPKGVYGGGEGFEGIDEVERTKLAD